MGFSINRIWAIIKKEFVLIKRDPAIIVIMAVMPLIMVCITGYAVNTFPENVPTVLVSYDQSPLTRDLVKGMENTGYISFVKSTYDPEEAYQFLRKGKAFLVVTIPPKFTKRFYRGKNPSILVEDGSVDSFSTVRAVMAINGLRNAYVKKINKRYGID